MVTPFITGDAWSHDVAVDLVNKSLTSYETTFDDVNLMFSDELQLSSHDVSIADWQELYSFGSVLGVYYRPSDDALKVELPVYSNILTESPSISASAVGLSDLDVHTIGFNGRLTTISATSGNAFNNYTCSLIVDGTIVSSDVFTIKPSLGALLETNYQYATYLSNIMMADSKYITERINGSFYNVYQGALILGHGNLPEDILLQGTLYTPASSVSGEISTDSTNDGLNHGLFAYCQQFDIGMPSTEVDDSLVYVDMSDVDSFKFLDGTNVRFVKERGSYSYLPYLVTTESSQKFFVRVPNLSPTHNYIWGYYGGNFNTGLDDDDIYSYYSLYRDLLGYDITSFFSPSEYNHVTENIVTSSLIDVNNTIYIDNRITTVGSSATIQKLYSIDDFIFYGHTPPLKSNKFIAEIDASNLTETASIQNIHDILDRYVDSVKPAYTDWHRIDISTFKIGTENFQPIDIIYEDDLSESLTATFKYIGTEDISINDTVTLSVFENVYLIFGESISMTDSISVGATNLIQNWLETIEVFDDFEFNATKVSENSTISIGDSFGLYLDTITVTYGLWQIPAEPDNSDSANISQIRTAMTKLANDTNVSFVSPGWPHWFDSHRIRQMMHTFKQIANETGIDFHSYIQTEYTTPESLEQIDDNDWPTLFMADSENPKDDTVYEAYALRIPDSVIKVLPEVPQTYFINDPDPLYHEAGYIWCRVAGNDSTGSLNRRLYTIVARVKEMQAAGKTRIYAGCQLVNRTYNTEYQYETEANIRASVALVGMFTLNKFTGLHWGLDKYSDIDRLLPIVDDAYEAITDLDISPTARAEQPKVALLRFDPMNGAYNRVIYEMMCRSNVDFDIIRIGDLATKLNNYTVLVIPRANYTTLSYLTEDQQTILQDYVSNGGTIMTEEGDGVASYIPDWIKGEADELNNYENLFLSGRWYWTGDGEQSYDFLPRGYPRYPTASLSQVPLAEDPQTGNLFSYEQRIVPIIRDYQSKMEAHGIMPISYNLDHVARRFWMHNTWYIWIVNIRTGETYIYKE